MCRLLFVQNSSEFSISSHLKSFARVAKESKEFQGHGWGCSYLKKGSWEHYHNIKPIWEDKLEQFAGSTRLIAHARSAFEDKDIVVENNMPFNDDKYVFIFNGELRGVKINAPGRIGAEKIFNFIKRFDKGTASPATMTAALEKGTDIIKKRSSHIRAMNIIIAEKDKVYYFSHFNEDPAYFGMSYRETGDELVICSQTYIGETGWNKIENNSQGVFLHPAG